MSGTIYLVGTPIGNLEDITLRALRILKEVDLIAAEDTRRTAKLLNHFAIRKPLVSYHEHNEPRRADELVGEALGGKSIALVSDAGMPVISDPGYRLVVQAVARGVPVVPVPGPVAAETAMAASGLPYQAFRFGGFLPPKRNRRRKVFEDLAADAATLVFFEAPHRIVAALDDVLSVLGPRPVVVAREMTKVHEEFLRGRADEVLAQLRRRPEVRGEITLLIAPGEAAPAAGNLAERVAELVRENKLTRMEALKQAARERGISKREAYRNLVGGCLEPPMDADKRR